MRKEITRREFLKMAGLGGMASVLLSRCGETAPHGFLQGLGNYLTWGEGSCCATTCGGCPRGCGVLVHTMSGNIQRIEGNPVHPLSQGAICDKAHTNFAINRDHNRIQGPLRRMARGSESLSPITWDTAARVLQDAFHKYVPGEMAFLMGQFPDHLHDLVQLIGGALGGIRVYRMNPGNGLDNCVTLMDATQKLFGAGKIPHFDVGNADVVISFGSNLSESWLLPGVISQIGKRDARLVYLGAHLPDIIAKEAEWIPIRPGSEAYLADALARLVSGYTTSGCAIASTIDDLSKAAESCGISPTEIYHLAHLFAQARSKVAIPGKIPLGNANGLSSAEAILKLNAAAKNLGKPGGLFLPPDSPIYPGLSIRSSTIAEIRALIEDMRRGGVKILLIHGVNPVNDLPNSLGFDEALKKVELVISFASLHDRTSKYADYLFPDHATLEGWGYQRANLGGDRITISTIQPVVPTLYNTRSTANLLLSATRASSGEIAHSISFSSELDFLRKSLTPLIHRNGSYTVHSQDELWTRWLETGGWWQASPSRIPPVVCDSIFQPGYQYGMESLEDGQFFYLLLPSSNSTREKTLSKLDAFTPQKERPQVEMHPQTARDLGVCGGDLVKINSPAGEMLAAVQEVESIRPDTLGISIPEGDDRFPSGDQMQEENPLNLLGNELNESGDLAFAAGRVVMSGIVDPQDPSS